VLAVRRLEADGVLGGQVELPAGAPT
jgi:hypothetical protein